MPENKNGKERTEGQTAEAKSSDTFVARRLDQIRAQLEGVDQRIGPVEGEILKPKSIGRAQATNESGSRPNILLIDPQRLSHTDSALASRFRRTRIEKKLRLKRAA